MNILIADDEKGLVEVLKDLLVKKGHTVVTAFDGSAALELINQNQYDIAFLDFSMPEVTGLELVERIKKLEHKTKTVVITAYPLMKDFLIQQVGADEFLAKPFNFKEVEDILRKYSNP